MKAERKSSSWKSFLLTLAATTFSIVLTFGTSAVIEHRKLNAEKREMVLMIMYDMRETLKEVEQIDADLKDFFEIQVDLVAHPDKLDQRYVELATKVPVARFSTTTETIFRSNIETIRTIGNILFVEAVSSFYDSREQYKTIVIDDFQSQSERALFDSKALGNLNTPNFIFYSEAFLRSMTVDFENCKKLMKVTDDDLEVFSRQKEKLMESTQSKMREDTEESSSVRNERSVRFQQALEQGEKELKNK
jgi:hypothetical protein